jgi:hypothetical protein
MNSLEWRDENKESNVKLHCKEFNQRNLLIHFFFGRSCFIRQRSVMFSESLPLFEVRKFSLSDGLNAQGRRAGSRGVTRLLLFPVPDRRFTAIDVKLRGSDRR